MTSKITYRPVQRLQKNRLGRDFVVGDIHGAYDQVLAAMQEVSFDKEIDRILSVGDLIDRGLESARCLKFLQQPYVYAIRGNHEQNLLEIFAKGRPHPDVMDFFIDRYSMEWIRNVEQEQIDLMLEIFARLPLVIEVPTERGMVGMVHGEVPIGMAWGEFLAAIEAHDSEVMESALEGRKRIVSNNTSGVPGVDRLFVGHTPQRGGAKRYGNVYAIDTGAIFNPLKGKQYYGLTMANTKFATSILAGFGAEKVDAVMT